MKLDPRRKNSRWYFGGLAATGSAAVMHPLDLIKVHLQTQKSGKLRILPSMVHICKTQGFFALYRGLTASIFRQMSYSTARFAVYEALKAELSKTNRTSLEWKVASAAISGFSGGFIGTPGDVVNVRMQNDTKLPKDQRRGYTNVFNGIWRIINEEGISKLFSGASAASCRAMVLTIGQLASYDHIKEILLHHGFNDTANTHVLTSIMAGVIAVTITQPIDVIKTRLMFNKGEYSVHN
ncbi:mitochondrial dicarboxylate carrier isoform X2 [Nilaparvata lugens]|uniref:mitochondrial dicarboxylate carrier isoform X2 n=1 Tax=Nilaparvata lugens TaxID=108931 RepID=UPI00193CF498|nr:mitochondrial dicarboxylate carrier isoform X2 [Nilaparvata lugens]